MSQLLQEMMSHADPSQVEGLSRFFKTGPGQYGEGDKFLGIKVPVTREVVRDCWKSVNWADLEECISSEYHEMRLAALEAFLAPRYLTMPRTALRYAIEKLPEAERQQYLAK